MRFAVLLFAVFVIGCSSGNEDLKAYTSVAFPKISIEKKTLEKDSTTIQTRLCTDLSYLYNYKTTYFSKHKNHEAYYCIRIVEVFDKKNGVRLDSIGLDIPDFMSYFELWDETRSYVTGKNRNKQMVDNYAGDFVVADLNFDGKEDFAMASDVGASVGPYCTFYVQKENGKFVKDAFLTDSVEFFPHKIDAKNNTLMTLVHASACCVGEHKYKINSKGEWHQISHRILGEQ